jgi:hypothetical protein
MLTNQVPKIVSRLDMVPDCKRIIQFYRADLEFVIRRDETLRHIVNVLGSQGHLNKGKYVSIDSRTHMLMPGWYPCIPGWHCDDFYRPDGQPDLENLPPIQHYSVVFGADVATTEFIWTPTEFASPTEIYEVEDSEAPLYGYYNQFWNSRTSLDGVVKRKASSGELIQFSGLSFHRGLAAVKSGWRTFVRVTVSDHREPKNEIRKQTQVYLTDPFKGW